MGLDNTLLKNDSLHSKGLYQVTEKNSENQSVINPPSQLAKHISNKASKMSHSQKSLQDTSNEVRSSILFAELSRLEKELKEQGAQKVM